MAQLYKQNESLVQKMINPYIAAGLEAEDGLQEGFVALCHAVDNYDPGAGMSFSTYFGQWIRATVGRLFRSTAHVKRLPEYLHGRIYRYNQYCGEYRQAHGKEPTDEDIMQALDISAEQLEALRRAIYEAETISFSQPIRNAASEAAEMQDIIPDDRDAIAEAIDRVDEEQAAAILWAAVGSLSAEQADALRIHYQEGQTLTATAAAFGVSLETIRRREKKAFNILREHEGVKQVAADYGYSSIIYNGGLHYFRNTGTSVVEETVIRRLEGK